MGCTKDGSMGAAYVDVVSDDMDNKGQATHMLSYAWHYTVQEIADSLSTWCSRTHQDPKRVYVWMDCFCVNQHRRHAMKEEQTEIFKDTSRHGHVGSSNMDAALSLRHK